MNCHLLVCDPSHFRVDHEINAYMSTDDQPHQPAALAEHADIVEAHLGAGRRVERLTPVPECADMVFTANAALVREDRAVLAALPEEREHETPHHRAWLQGRGIDVLASPYPFSGQGDALPCGEWLLAGSGWRSDPRVHDVLRDHLGYTVVPLRTVDRRWYDIDLVVGIVEPGRTVAYCPDALDEPSRGRLHDLGLDLIPVALEEARRFALNLIGDGGTVTMGHGAPRLAAELRERDLKVVELDTTELGKGGGGVRCTALTLDNP